MCFYWKLNTWLCISFLHCTPTYMIVHKFSILCTHIYDFAWVFYIVHPHIWLCMNFFYILHIYIYNFAWVFYVAHPHIRLCISFLCWTPTFIIVHEFSLLNTRVYDCVRVFSIVHLRIKLFKRKWGKGGGDNLGLYWSLSHS